MSDVYAVVRGIAGGSILSVLAAAYLYRFELFSRAVFLIDAGLLFLFVIVSRASFRLMSEAVATRSKRTRRVLIYGAGSGGQLLAREMRANRDWSMSPVGFLDDDPVKQRRWVLGLPVRRGAGELELSMRLHNVDDLIISSDSIDEGRETRIRKICERHDVIVRRLFLEIR
jgi:UDP-GlcNAc:undecaprenyl-phosphate GlcNAc-1-phosphate transferase